MLMHDACNVDKCVWGSGDDSRALMVRCVWGGQGGEGGVTAFVRGTYAVLQESVSWLEVVGWYRIDVVEGFLLIIVLLFSLLVLRGWYKPRTRVMGSVGTHQVHSS
jgi:hypothetical protein